MSDKIEIKNEDQIKIMKEGGAILSETLWKVMDAAQVGVSERELDRLAERLIRDKGGEPAFMRVEDYKHTLCVSTNSVVVHGIPGEYKLVDGDEIGIDCGVFYKGLNTDMSHSKIVGKKDPEVEKFLSVGEKALHEAIAQATFGNHVGHISAKIQEIVEGNGYSVVKSLIGHGVGRNLHEPPEVPGYLHKGQRVQDTPPLIPGMTIAVEVIYNMKKDGVVYSRNDGWTIETEDEAISGLFERTIAITEGEPVILTP